MWEVFNVYGDRSENAESNYKYSGGKNSERNLGVRRKHQSTLLSSKYAIQMNLSLQYLQPKQKKSHIIISRDWMRW
jgi:hypothetical protein